VLFRSLRIHFTDTRVLDTWASPTCWETPFVRFKQPARVKAGDHVELCIQSDLSGNASYSLQMTHRVDGSTKWIGEYAWSGD